MEGSSSDERSTMLNSTSLGSNLVNGKVPNTVVSRCRGEVESSAIVHTYSELTWLQHCFPINLAFHSNSYSIIFVMILLLYISSDPVIREKVRDFEDDYQFI